MIAPAAGHQVIAAEELRQFFRRHPDAVVADGQRQIAVRSRGRDKNGARLRTLCDPMQHAVFHDRLQNKLWNLRIEQLARNLRLIGEQILITQLLDIDVLFQIKQFVAERHGMVDPAEAVIDHTDKRADRLADSRRSLQLRHPADGIERVADKVRVDLLLQNPDFEIMPFFVVAANCLDAVIQRLDHVIEAKIQISDLICRSRLHTHGKIAALHLIHAGAERCDGENQPAIDTEHHDGNAHADCQNQRCRQP